MKAYFHRWRSLVILALLLAPLLWPLQYFAERYYSEQLAEQNRQTLDLYVANLLGTLRRYEELPQILGGLPVLRQALQQPGDPLLQKIANEALADIRRRTGADVIYLLQPDGTTQVASNWAQADSFVHRNFAFRPYYREAMQGRLARFFGLGTTSIKPADRVWTPSQYSADEAVRLFPGVAGKVRVLPNQVDGFAGEPADLSARGLPPRYWLLVGTRELRKNVPWFVSAWARARAQAPGVPPLVLVGSLDHLPEEQRGLPGLHALGGLDDAELHALYRQAERLWQPSYAEGFGLPVVEALSVGTPVAVASGTSLDEVTPPSAPRFSPSDGAALERLMLRLADAPREASAEELIAWAARFNREAYRQRLAALIEELS